MAEGMIVTEAGLNLLATALTGERLHFTRGAVGDGDLGSNDPYKLTGLINEKKSLAIQEIRTSKTGICETLFEVSNADIETGFWMREYGLFALNPNTGEEILYSYRNTGTHSGYLEGNNGVDLINFTLTLTTVIDQAENITATISTANNYITASRLDARIAGLYAKDSEIAGVYTYGSSTPKRFTPTSIQALRTSIMGVTDINALQKRQAMIEDNMANILLMLEKNEIYPEYSHYLIEDFRNPDTADMFTAKVLRIVADDETVDVDDLSGIIPGSIYTIADGTKSEQGRVKSLSTENGVKRIRFEEGIKNTYTPGTVHLMRSTADVSGGTATGTAGRMTVSWLPNEEWQGAKKDTAKTISLNLKASGWGEWDTEGNTAPLSAGGITLKEGD